MVPIGLTETLVLGDRQREPRTDRFRGQNGRRRNRLAAQGPDVTRQDRYMLTSAGQGASTALKKHVRGLAAVDTENTRNICSQDNLHGWGHHSPRPRWGLCFQDRPGPAEYQHHRNHNCRATENRFRNE